MLDIEPVAKPDVGSTASLPERSGIVTDGHTGSEPVKTARASRAYLCNSAFPPPRSAPQSRLAPLSRETAIGEDDRERVLETDLPPWRMIASLRLVVGEKYFIGTGWFAGPRTLITAGHCVHDHRDFGGWVDSVEVSPGRNDEETPFDEVSATKVASLKGWVENADPDQDIGCIQLDQPLGDRVGWLPVAAYPDERLIDREVGISGYPKDRGQGRIQYFDANLIAHVDKHRLYYAVDTSRGQSGAPVWLPRGPDDLPHVVGVHAYGVSDPRGGVSPGNSAPRITEQVLGVIRGWVDEASSA